MLTRIYFSQKYMPTYSLILGCPKARSVLYFQHEQITEVLPLVELLKIQ